MMPVLLAFVGVLAAHVTAVVAALIRRGHPGWLRRGDIRLLLLAAPLINLGLTLDQVRDTVGRLCFLGRPPWDYRMSVAWTLIAALSALGAITWGVARLVLLERLRRCGLPAPPALQARVTGLARHLGSVVPQTRLVPVQRPLALTVGLTHPTVLLSTWMVAHLDAQELEAVLAHELAHVRRRDALLVWLAAVLRDAFWYLPSSWTLYRQFRRGNELACDDLAVQTTGRPLALASALARVWLRAAAGPVLSGAPSLTAGEAVEARIARLLEAAPPSAHRHHAEASALSIGLGAVGALLLLSGAAVTVLLKPAGCALVSPLAHLLT